MRLWVLAAIFIANPAYSGAQLPSNEFSPEGAQAFVQKVFDAWNGPDVAVLNGLYADQVDFYGSIVPEAKVQIANSHFAARWQIRNYTIASIDQAKCDAQASTCLVTGVVSWDDGAPGPKLHSVGDASFYYTLQYQNGQFLISGEGGKVLDRTVTAEAVNANSDTQGQSRPPPLLATTQENADQDSSSQQDQPNSQTENTSGQQSQNSQSSPSPSGNDGSVWWLVVVCVIALGAFIFLLDRSKKIKEAAQQRANHEAMLRKVGQIVIQHQDALSRRRLQLVKKDAYGKELTEKWDAEINHFLDNHVQPLMSEIDIYYYLMAKPTLPLVINNLTQQHAKDIPLYKEFREGMSPTEFETFCAEALAGAGWDARVTMASRDQGVDIIAEKDDLRLVAQCKLYARAVGNKAVQEIVAGKVHEGADFAMVVSNSRFTESAEQLAKTNSVYLLHFSDLGSIDQILGLDAI